MSKLSSEQWQQVSPYLDEALALPEPERAAWLASLRSRDATLADLLETLLADHQVLKKEQFLEQNPILGSVLGPYQLLSPLGSGGMGEVYRARDTRLDRTVAIKILPHKYSSDPVLRQRFEREAKAISSLQHPNICTLHDVGRHENTEYIVMEFLEGQTLSAALSQGPLPAEKTIQYTIEVADALDTAHRRGIIHRDLKPANIFVTARGECKVLDFGLAKIGGNESSLETATSLAKSGQLTTPGMAMGTVAYMSPEQARGEALDARTDIFSLGAVLYEMATGKLAFPGPTWAVIFKAILDHTPPPPSESNPQIPAPLDDIIAKALEKDRDLRYRSAADLRSDLKRLQRDTASGIKPRITAARPQRSSRLARWATGLLLSIALVVSAFVLWRKANSVAPSDSSQWVQLTNLTGESFEPTLSPDGRMLAFLRSIGGSAQLYVKLLPDGEPVQLTHDEIKNKLTPVFSPDGSRIAYGTSEHDWQTWVIPVLGGQPQLLLSNATGLSWIDTSHVMFSEIKSGVHLAVVTSTESRSEQRDVYVPPDENNMAHFSYLSPDHKWVLVAEMGGDGMIPCQLIPFSGGAARSVGPQSRGCEYAAWSRDGKWMYFSSDAGSKGYHIWRQAFPDGVPQQLTASLGEEEGIAMAPDGRSFVTSVGTSERGVWVHDQNGERQVSSQGYSYRPRFSSDGSRVFYLVAANSSQADHGSELWVSDLGTGQASKVLPGIVIQHFSVSPDDKQVVFETLDANGQHHLWLSSTERRSAPRHIRSAGDAFLPEYSHSGRIYFLLSEAGHDYLYRMKNDGTQEEKVSTEPVLYLDGISPDERFVVVERPLSREDHSMSDVEAVPVAGGPWVPLCSGWCDVNWDRDGQVMYFYWRSFTGNERTYVVPVIHGSNLPKLPSSGFQSEAELRAVATQVLEGAISSGPDISRYTFSKETSRRNLYRIPLQ